MKGWRYHAHDWKVFVSFELSFLRDHLGGFWERG